MNKKPARLALIVISTALFLCGSIFPVAASTVAHWKFEEGPVGSPATGANSILDSSGNNQHGTPIGGPIYTSVSNPKSAVGLRFDGVNDFITIVDNPLFELRSFTLEAFIKIDGVIRPVMMIVHRGDDRNGLDNFHLLVINGHLRINFFGPNGENVNLDSLSALPLGQFIHVATTFNGSTGRLKLFVDGQEVSHGDTTVTPVVEMDPNQNPVITIGGALPPHCLPPFCYFYGIIDEVRISNVALDPSAFLLYEPIACIGFEAPMNNGPVKVRKAKGGREFPPNAPGTLVLPLKVILDDSGDLITDADIVARPVLQVLYSSGVSVANDVTADALPAGGVTKGNQFAFTNDGKWGFNLGTWNYTAPGTYTISVASGDETEYVISPTCTATFVVE